MLTYTVLNSDEELNIKTVTQSQYNNKDVNDWERKAKKLRQGKN